MKCTKTLFGLGLFSLFAICCARSKPSPAPSTSPARPAASKPPAHSPPPKPLQESSGAPKEKPALDSPQPVAPQRRSQPSSLSGKSKKAQRKRLSEPVRPSSNASKRTESHSEDRGGTVLSPAIPVARRLLQLEQRLNAVRGGKGTGCSSARERSKAICDLAEQICQLVDRDPNVASLASHCNSARGRCRQATESTRRSCSD